MTVARAEIIQQELLDDEPMTAGGFRDEALQKDLTWEFTPVIVEWERAESSDDLIEISEEEAERIIERFRARWGGNRLAVSQHAWSQLSSVS